MHFVLVVVVAGEKTASRNNYCIHHLCVSSSLSLCQRATGCLKDRADDDLIRFDKIR